MRRIFALVAFGLAWIPGPLARSRAETPPLRVLFIGNSYTRSNNLPRMVERIARGVVGGPLIEVTKIANPGWDLTRHWAHSETHAQLSSRLFTHVVLQGHSLTAIEHRADFETTARLFDAEIDRSGARTVLYETWARSPTSPWYRHDHLAESPTDMQARVSECYGQLARELGASVAPAGRAFLLAQQRYGRTVSLFRSDGHHPNAAGTYLAAAVVYAAVTGRDPRQTEWRPYPMTREEARNLLDVANTVSH